MGVQKAYSEELAKAYDDRHFGGRSGQYILRRDCEALQALLERPPGLILDIPCGTGAYVTALLQTGYDVIAADASPPMLQVTGRRAADTRRVLCDVNHLPFRDGTFDAVVTIRLFSHYRQDDVTRMLLELRRAIRPGGRVVFDTFRWTPRRWPFFRRFLDESCITVLSPRQVEEVIRKAGLRKMDVRWLYLFSPLWQRKLPFPVLRLLTALETVLPQRWLLRAFWACTRSQNACINLPFQAENQQLMDLGSCEDLTS